MKKISVSKYPKCKEWNEKINSTPNIPGGKESIINNLRNLLILVQNHSPLNQVPTLKGSNSKSTLNQLCVHQLSAIKFVEREVNGEWILTKEAKLWLDTEDDLYLAAYFCANVKFFAEILFYLDSPKTSRELFNIAVNNYDMTWKIPTTINNRLVWLRQFGLIEFQEFSLLYSITEKGKDFLKSVEPVMPENIIMSEDDTTKEKDVFVDEAFITYFNENRNTVRKSGFGYFPGKINNVSQTLSVFIDNILIDSNIESIKNFAFKKYNIKDSSVRSALNSISGIGLIERKTNTSYDVTDLGYCWSETHDILSLLPLFQIRYLFLLEILMELKDRNLSLKELATLSKVSYGFNKENVFEINNRISILKQAKLVMNISPERFKLTNRGKIFLDKYGKIFKLSKSANINDKTDSTNNVNIISQLRLASKDSYNPEKFEKVVRDFFELLGFDSEWLGGSGKTDVLLKTTGSPIDSFVVTVDAKTTSANVVTDNLVDFDTLKEHQKKHSSNYIAVVGRDFNDRLIKRAIEHHVVLFDVDTLENLLNIHQSTPQKLVTYRKIFEQSGRADLSVLDEDIKRKDNMGNLLIGIMQCLIAECKDPITKGQLSVRDLYMSLRRDKNLLTTPTIEEIEDALKFLSSPIIGCVFKSNNFYCATGSIRDMAGVLDFLKMKCDNINTYN